MSGDARGEPGPGHPSKVLVRDARESAIVTPSWTDPPARWLMPRATVIAGLGVTLALAVAPPAHAGLYKCARDDGTVMYQEDPARAGKELRDFERDPGNGLGRSVSARARSR